MKNKVVLIVAVLFGLLAAVLTRTYLSSKSDEFKRLTDRFNATHGTLDALCFKTDVPSGTVISKDNLGILTVPEAGLRGQALTKSDLQVILGRKILLGHRKGDILFWSDIEGGNPVAGGLAADIRRKKRAFPKPAPDGKNVLQELVTCTILQNVLVLATGKETSKSGSSPFGSGSYSTVTLEVSPREAEMLVFAEQIRGRLVLSLRNRNDTSYEKELPQVDFEKIRSEIEDLNAKRQAEIGGGR